MQKIWFANALKMFCPQTQNVYVIFIRQNLHLRDIFVLEINVNAAVPSGLGTQHSSHLKVHPISYIQL